MIHTLSGILNKRLIAAFFMGISSGLPLLITSTLMQAWAKDSGISLKDIGLMSLVGLPYTLKFLWSPLFDRFSLPFLGRRRGWLLMTQILTAIAIAFMGISDPADSDSGILIFVLAGFLITFFSASQDIVIDAYRREDLRDNELIGLGSSYSIYGYRLGMLIVSGGGMILSVYIAWPMVFFCMAGCMLTGIIVTLVCKEPVVLEKPPSSFQESVIDPFADYFRKDNAILILIFILLFKVGDNMAAALTIPFYKDIGFDNMEIGVIVKLYGFWATLIGTFTGGILMLKTGINRSLWICGFLQMISTAGFFILSNVGKSTPLLAAVISFENLSAAMGTAAFMAFMASITNKKFTATQYALLTSLMGVPRVLISSGTGYLVNSIGWSYFFIFCTIIAIPGMLLLLKFAPWNKSNK